MLEASGLAAGYNGQAVVEDISFQLEAGRIVTLIGPNGAGKSTVLRTVIRQLSPVRGALFLDGRPMDSLAAQDLARRLSVLMTDRVKPELMTCFDVVSTGRYPYTGRLGILTDTDRGKIWEALALVGGTELAGQDFTRISDGQRQRVLLARALCQEPEILVLDEPTSFLDIRFKLELLSVLKKMARKHNLAILMSLHELELAQRVSDYIFCVHNGRIERRGTPEEIFAGDFITKLYEAEKGSYDPLLGCLELERVDGEPTVFVIGGGGSGLPVYRRLQRLGVPFAAGVLHENDLDYPVASAVAAAVISERGYVPIQDDAFNAAVSRLSGCRYVLCPLTEFGPMNEKNRRLMEMARNMGRLAPTDLKDFETAESSGTQAESH